MKRILSLALILGMVLTAAACGTTEDTDASTTLETTSAETTEAPVAPITPSVNEGEFKAGVYTGSAFYTEMGMPWNFVLTMNEDGTFVLKNDTDEEKGSGTYALTENCYTMTYSDDRTCTFVVQKDGTLKMTTDFPYGMATIQLALVGDIIFTFEKDIAAGGNEGGEEGGSESTEIYTLGTGTYTAKYEKVSQMAGTVIYDYTAIVGADGTFSYSVKFAMGENVMDGSSAKGTYTLQGNVFTFTDSEGNAIEGKLTADDTLVISLKASQMASSPYEVTLEPVSFKMAAGTYNAKYEKVSQMAGAVIYDYTATIGADGTFSYFVKFDMGGTMMDGSSAKGTYTIKGSVFTFTDSEGNITKGKLTADNTLVISLKASPMASAPYEVTFSVKN